MELDGASAKGFWGVGLGLGGVDSKASFVGAGVVRAGFVEADFFGVDCAGEEFAEVDFALFGDFGLALDFDMDSDMAWGTDSSAGMLDSPLESL